jgi:hypothetical protein
MHHGGVETTVVSDAALASLAQGGDVEALAALLDRCRPSLYAAAVGLLGNRADALDAVQDTFVVAHFTRCTSYEAIARVTSVPVGTVRSRLNRARRRLADVLMATASGTPMSHADLEAAQRTRWEEFYRLVHQQPVPRTYQELFAPDVDVRDPAGHWYGIEAWSAEEHDAITLGVHASVVGVLASSELTVLEIDFSNPATWPDHCPPQATFVHRLSKGRSRQLRIHYPGEHSPPDDGEQG